MSIFPVLPDRVLCVVLVLVALNVTLYHDLF